MPRRHGCPVGRSPRRDGANLSPSADYPNGAAIVRTESRRTVAADCRRGVTVSEPVAVGRSPRERRGRSERPEPVKINTPCLFAACGQIGTPRRDGLSPVSRRVKCPCKGGANGAADCPNPSAGPSAADRTRGGFQNLTETLRKAAHRNGRGRGGCFYP